MAAVPRLRSAFDGAHPPDLAAAYAATAAWALARLHDADWLVQVSAGAHAQSYPVVLAWLGLDWDEGPDVGGQGNPSTRTPSVTPADALRRLADAGCVTGDPPGVVQLKLPTPGVTTLDFAHAGALTFDNAALWPVELLSADGGASAALQTVLDDRATQTTLRAIVDAPEARLLAARAAAIAAALGWAPPALLRLPALPAEVAAQPLAALRAEGVLPAALFSQLLLCAWPRPGERVLIDKWTARTQLQLADLYSGTAHWDAERLAQLNRAAIAQRTDAELAPLLRDFLEEAYGDLPAGDAWLVDLAATVRPQLTRLADVETVAQWAFEQPHYSAAARAVLSQPGTRGVLVQLLAELTAVVLLDRATAAALLAGLQARVPLDVTTVLTAALVGQVGGPPLARVLALLGKARAQERIAALVRRAP